MASFLDSSYTEPLFGKALQDSLVHLWIAEADGEAAGYLQAAEGPLPYPGPVLKPFELQRLYVDAAHHGQGMAATLMQQYLDVAKDLEAPYLWLGVWEHNLRAQAFYRKWGFGPTGHTHPFPIGNTPQTDQWWSRTL
jgi:ribosomal protein S18 acetylase RimI-like enzyme